MQNCVLSKLVESIKRNFRSEVHDGEIPFEHLRMNQKDYHRVGSQGHVFFGEFGNTPVAIKRTSDVSQTNIKHLRQLRHKNVLEFHGISRDSKYHYIIMEWCQYGTLHDHLHSDKNLSLTQLSDFAQQIASGMSYLHSKNIIHRDLKPSNILITHDNVLKVSDFGLHEILADRSSDGSSEACAGTLAYMAPEIFLGQPCSFPIDVWSYGVVLWEILIGEEPYKNHESSAVIWAIGNHSFRLPIPYCFLEGFSSITNGCWKQKPAERFTFSQICVLLRGAMQQVRKIPEEVWPSLRAGWKRDVRDKLKVLSQPDNNTNEDLIYQQKHQAVLEQAQERLHKNNTAFLELQQCKMYLRTIYLRELDALDKVKKDIERRSQLLAEKEEALIKKEEAMAEKEANLTKEINVLKNRLKLVEDRVPDSTLEELISDS